MKCACVCVSGLTSPIHILHSHKSELLYATQCTMRRQYAVHTGRIKHMRHITLNWRDDRKSFFYVGTSTSTCTMMFYILTECVDRFFVVVNNRTEKRGRVRNRNECYHTIADRKRRRVLREKKKRFR